MSVIVWCGASMSEKGLTVKNDLFIAEYLINGFNATQGAITAGYSEKTAYSIGYELLRKPEIQEEIRARILVTVGDKNKILSENINFWIDMRDNAEVNEAARLKASEHLGKYADMFTEKVDVNHKIDTNVIDELRAKYENK